VKREQERNGRQETLLSCQYHAVVANKMVVGSDCLIFF